LTHDTERRGLGIVTKVLHWAGTKEQKMRLPGNGLLARVCAALIVAASVAYGCTAVPSSSPSTLDCGPLAAEDCAAAIEVAKARLAAGVVPTSIRVASPAPGHTCPPSGGLAGSHACSVIVVVSTGDGSVEVGLLRTTSGGWVDGVNIR
jgi:hypothetical protein